MKALILALVLFFAWPALAVNDWGYTNCESGTTVGHGKTICYDFDSTVASDALNVRFSVNSNDALACLRPSVAAAGAATAQGELYFCPGGGTTTATCGIQAGASASVTLTGANGVPAAQQACVTIGPGQYLFRITVVPGGGETALFSVTGGN